MLCSNCGSAQAQQASAPAGSERGGKGTVRIFLSVFLSLILVLSAFSALLVANFRMAFTEDSLKQMLSDLSLEDFPVEQILGDGAGSKDEMAGWLEDVIYDETGIQADITQEKLEQFLEESTVLPFLSGEMAAYIDSFFSGTYEAGIGKEEIAELVLENAELLENTFDVAIGEQEAERVADWFEASGTLETLTLREPEENSEAKAVLDLARRLFSYATLGGLTALAVLMVGLLFLVNRKQPGTALCFAGVPLMIGGGLVGLLGPLSALLSDTLASAFGGGALVGKVIHGTLSAGQIPCLAVLVVGFAALVGGIVLKKRGRA